MRENDLGAVAHPDPLRTADTRRELTLIIDPLTERLTKGDPTLGWEGDRRLALYLDVPGRTWELWRLESDGIYRPCIRLSADTWRGPEVVAEMVVRLRATDVRRGFDPLVAVTRITDARERADDVALADFTAEAASRFVHGLRRDGAL